MEYTSDIKEDQLLSEDVRDSLREWRKDVSEDETYSKTVEDYKHSTKKKMIFIVVTLICAIAVTIYSLQYSPLVGDAWETLCILWDSLWGKADPESSIVHWTLYVSPPVLGALIGGAGLAICGAIMQSVLRNPMADPYTTGISSGASFGAALAIASGTLLLQNPSLIVILAFGFSMIPVMVILSISKMTNASPITIIMTGIGIMYIFNALTSLVKLKGGSTAMAALDNWLMGDVQLVEWADLLPMTLIVLAGIIISMYLAGKMNVLATGDDSAKALGINADKLRIFCLILTAIVSAGVISFTGLIGFVGLVCPHIARMMVGADNKYLIPASAVIGCLLMVAGHFVGKTIIAPTLIPVGIIMSCIGGPVFIWLVMRKNKGAW